MHFAGTMRLEAELDIADALDLDRALAHGAARLKALGSDASLDARRPRPSATSPGPRPRSTSPEREPTAQRPARRREVVLHAHFDASPRRR